MKHHGLRRSGALAVVVVAAARVSLAQDLQVTFEGVINSGSDLSGRLGFGAGSDALTGRSVTGSFTYAPQEAPADDNAAADIALHETFATDEIAWFSLPEVSVDGVAVPRPDFTLLEPLGAGQAESFAQILLRDDAVLNGEVRDDLFYNRFRFVSNEGGDFADFTVQLGVLTGGATIGAAEIGLPYETADLAAASHNSAFFSASSVEGFEIITSFELTRLSVAAVSGCACELDGNASAVDVFDLLAFLDGWFAQDAGADLDGTAGVDVFDLLFFLDCWFPASAGVPCG